MINDLSLDRALADAGALREKHATKTASAGAFHKYRDDPLGFFNDVLKERRRWHKQDAIADALSVPNARVVVAGCHASGKDYMSACLALWFAYCHDGFVVATSATDRQVRVAFMGELARRFKRSLPGELYEMSLRVDRSIPSGVIAFSTTETSKFSGIHAPRMLVILSEAQGLPAEVWDGAYAIATGDDVRILALGNPVIAAGKFYDVYRSPRWTAVQMSALEHPNVVEGKPIIPGGPSRAWVEEVKQEYGEESVYYIGRVLGEFPEDASETLVRRRWLEAAAARFSSEELEEQARAGKRMIAIDPARYGPDKTALVFREGPVIRCITAWGGTDVMESTGRAIAFAKDRNLTTESYPLPRGHELYSEASHIQWGKRQVSFVIDEIGLGGGMLDRLREQGHAATAFNASRVSRFPERFHNLRAEAFWGLRILLDQGKLAMPKDDALWEELCGLMWKVNSSGKVQIEAKDEFRARLGRSPDRADALAMACHGLAPFTQRLTVSRNPI